MGDVSDWLKNQNLMTGTANDVAADIEGVINTYSTGGAYVEAGKLVLEALGVLGADDTKKKLDTLITLFGELFAVLQANFDVWRMDQVGREYENVLTTQQHLSEHPGDLTYLKQNAFDLDQNSLDPVNQLADDKSWVRPLFPQAVYSDLFSGTLAPPGSSGPGSIVFDYRLTLSVFLYAIAVRMTVLWALAEVDPHYRDIGKSEASRYGSLLSQRYQQMRAGIVSIRPLTFQELRLPQMALAGSSYLMWQLAKRPYGAVDTFSTFAVISEYPSDDIPNLNQNAFQDVLQGMYDQFFFRHWMGTTARWKRVYRQMGLTHLSNVIDDLKAIAGEPPEQRTWLDTGDWSLLQAERSTPESIFPRHGSLGGPISVRDWLTHSFGSQLWGAPNDIAVRLTLEDFAGLR